MAIALSGSLVLTGSLTTSGNIVAQTLVVSTISSSVEYSSGSNIFGNSTANTQTFTGSVNITGSVGINTGVPAYTLDVNGTGRFTGRVGINGSATTYGLTATGNTYLIGQTSGTSDYGLVVQNSGFNNLFLIRNDGQATFSSSVTATQYTSTANIAFVLGNAANNDFTMGGSSSSMRILNNTQTTALFQITNAGAATFAGIVTANGGRYNVQGANQNTVFFNQNAGGTSTGFVIGRSYGSTDTQDFFIYDVAASTPRMFISSGGNVGIGTTSPNSILHIKGALSIQRSVNSDTSTISNEGGNFYINAASGYNTIFQNGSTEYMRITSGGNVGINKANPGSMLDVSGSGTGICCVQATSPSGTTAAVIQSSSPTAGSTSWYAYVAQSGNGSVVTTNTMFVYGNGNVVNLNNSYGTLSDIKLKENIVDATPKLADIMNLKVRNFNFIADENKTKQIGFIAQEIEEIFPGLIEENPDRDIDNNDLGTVTKTVKTSVLVPMLVKAIQEQQAQIEELKSLINK